MPKNMMKEYRDECLKLLTQALDACIDGYDATEGTFGSPKTFDAVLTFDFAAGRQIASHPQANFPAGTSSVLNRVIRQPPHPTPDNLADAFKMVEMRSPQVVRVYLHPDTFESMVNSIEYHSLLERQFGCRVLGAVPTGSKIWGAEIRTSNDVPTDHLALIETGYQNDVQSESWKPEQHQLFKYDGLKVVQS